MKMLLTAFLCAIALLVSGQDFEGTIRWKISAQVDPAVEAQINQMMERMNDPQMKAMMDANPQMKAQMESMMQGGVRGMIPTGILVKIKDRNSVTVMEGGMMAMEVLHLPEKNQSVSIDRANKTYTIIDNGSSAENASNVTVSKTGKTLKILDYTCFEYEIEVTEAGQKMTGLIWATNEISGIDWSNLSNQGTRGGQMMFYKEVDGVPLKMEMSMPQMEMTMEVTEIKKDNLSPSEFVIPDGFKEVNGVEMMMGR